MQSHIVDDAADGTFFSCWLMARKGGVERVWPGVWPAPAVRLLSCTHVGVVGVWPSVLVGGVA